MAFPWFGRTSEAHELSFSSERRGAVWLVRDKKGWCTSHFLFAFLVQLSQGELSQAKSGRGKQREAKASQGKPRQGKARKGKQRQSQGKAKPKASKGKPRQGEASKGKPISVDPIR